VPTTLLPIARATDAHLHQAAEALADAVADGIGWGVRSVADRVAALAEHRARVRAGAAPAAYRLVLHGPRDAAPTGAGWCGWVPLADGAWQSSTYLAPHLRGTGLLDRLRCAQVHDAAAVTRAAAAAGEGPPRFASTIDVRNARSLAASLGYARRAGWRVDPGTWREVDQPDRGRRVVVLDWPPEVAWGAAPHPCVRRRRAAA